jgi:pimeloyl-ACP methyl ester carboxylesterase
VLRQGDGEPLVLFHGIFQSDRTWRPVIAPLAEQFDVIAPLGLGHGGRVPDSHPVSFQDWVDDSERTLDELGLRKAHLAGSSSGGWIAIELARHGRAKTVCALSPAGAWDREWEDMTRVRDALRTAMSETRRSRRLLPLLCASGRFRRFMMSDVAVHGDRLSRAEAVDSAEDVLACEVMEDAIADPSQLQPLDPPPCPITLAWSAEDRLFPIDLYGARAREMIPGARFIVLDGVGHVPMFDDPGLTADTIAVATKQPAAAWRQDLRGGARSGEHDGETA